MDILFKNTTKYTKDLYLSFLYFHNEKFGIKYHLFSLLVIIFFISCIILQLSNLLFVPAITLTIFLVGFVVYRYSFFNSKVSKELKSSKIADSKEITFCFYDNRIEIFTGNTALSVKYNQIYKIFDMPDLFYIYIGKQCALLVSKNGFTIGNALDFSDFLRKKCWRKYKQPD